ncbi:MAG: GDP-mannose 4,6-dehydratase [Pseudomonadota bacterium]|nr:GDP-mannose 4,6-dehydratase [Pseudomonadota bacterium]
MKGQEKEIHAALTGRRILILGGLGFIGSNLAAFCVAAGAKILVFDNLDPHSGGNLFNVAPIKKDISLHFHDILDFDRLVHHITDQDIIINCAASTSHPYSMREPWIDLDVNSRGVVNILEAIRRFNSEARFIHLGTSTQLGPLVYQPADENHPEFPTDIYSANKSVSEKYVLIYAKAYKIRATVIRLANVYGPRATIRSPEFTFNNYFVGLALKNQSITVYGSGEQKRNVIYVEDAVRAIMAAAVAEETVGETLFAVGDEHHSVADIARATVEEIGSGRVAFVEWPTERKRIEIGDALISNGKIKRFLNWRPRVDLRTGLAMTGKYYQPCLDRYFE